MNTEKESVSVDNFLENFKSKNKNVPLRNLYIFRVKDKDDNLVEERYGVNIVVRNGYSQVPFTSAYELVVGTGAGEYSYSRTSLFNQVGTSVSGSYGNSCYPAYYDSKRDLICQYFKLGTYTLDYTFANETFDITEFGIRSSSYGLLTHGQVLDSSGSPSHVTKNLYDKMEIEVRWLYVMSPEINRRLINLGIYGLFGLGQYINAWFYGLYYANTYQPSNASDTASYSVSYEPFSTNSQVKSLREWAHAPALLCEDSHLCISDFVCHGARSGENATVERGFLVVPIYTDPEELTSDIIYCNNHLTPNFGYMFQSIYKGKYDSYNLRGQFPVTNFEILSSYMYNHYTHQWDIEDQTTNCGNSEFRPTTWRWSLKLLTNDPNGVAKYVYITVNPAPNIQITSFDTSGIVVYATDEWWDNRTWILITDLNHLTYEQGTKRYYIMESDKIIYPTRDQEYPKFLYDRTYHWSTQVYDQNTSSGISTAIAVCCSDQYELYCSEKYMFFHPEGLPGGYDDQTACVQKTLIFTWPDSVVGGSSATPHISRTNRHIFDDKLVVCSDWYRSGSSSWSTNTSGTHIRILDISDPSVNMDPNAAIPYVDMQLEFTNKTYNTAGTISHTWDGDFWISYESNAKELICVKLHGGPNEDTPTQFTIGTGIEFWEFDYGTNHIIYRKTEDTLLYHYYDLDTQTDVNTFDITEFDSTVSTINNITGYNGIIYITAQYPNSSDKYTYFYDTSTGEWKVDKTFYSDALCKGWICGYNDECAVYIQNGKNDSIITIIDASDPYHFIHSPNYINTYGLDYVYAYACQLKYVKGKQLLLSVPCYYNSSNYEYYRNYVLDIGRILDEKKFYTLPNDSLNVYRGNYVIYQNCMYKDTVIYRGSGVEGSTKAYINLVPITQFVPHKVTISTRTLTAYNNPFRVSSTNMLQILESTTLSRLTADPVDISTYSPAILYRVDMFEGLTLSHRFVPCIRDADQMKGLFDVVAQEFLEPFDNVATTVDSTTAITTDYMLPSGYTQVYSIGCTGSLPNWITTDQMTHPVFHTANTKIEWYGKVSSSSKTWICLFGSKEFENEAAHSFAFYSKNSNGSFAYRRGSKTYYYKTDASLSKYDVDLKIVCDGLTASWYLMSDLVNPVATITISNGSLDDGVVPMAFMACGLTNGRDYNVLP